MVHSHVHTIISLLKRNNFVTVEKVGRETRISLTPAGEQVAIAFLQILSVLRKGGESNGNVG